VPHSEQWVPKKLQEHSRRFRCLVSNDPHRPVSISISPRRHPILEAIALTKRYASIPAVQKVSFCLEGGQVLGCLGPNGSGKSTTVKMLTGLLEPTEGQVLFHGEDIRKDLVGYRKCLGYVPEEANLYPYLTGREYLEMVGTLRGMAAAELSKKIDALLELFSLHPHRHGSIASYSKGMRQRILLIAALMDNPEILIFDEPLSGLDVTSALILKNLIQTLGQQGRAIFYCSHVLEVVEQVCSHLLILRKGNVIACDTTAAIQNNIEHKSLEHTFMRLVEEVDAGKITSDIVSVMTMKAA
jgi:ABC-2 type transport system ATP-binding protein